MYSIFEDLRLKINLCVVSYCAVSRSIVTKLFNSTRLRPMEYLFVEWVEVEGDQLRSPGKEARRWGSHPICTSLAI